MLHSISGVETRRVVLQTPKRARLQAKPIGIGRETHSRRCPCKGALADLYKVGNLIAGKAPQRFAHAATSSCAAARSPLSARLRADISAAVVRSHSASAALTPVTSAKSSALYAALRAQPAALKASAKRIKLSAASLRSHSTSSSATSKGTLSRSMRERVRSFAIIGFSLKLMGQGKPCPVGLGGLPALKRALHATSQHACTVPFGTAQSGPSGFANGQFGHPCRAVTPSDVTEDSVAAVPKSPD